MTTEQMYALYQEGKILKEVGVIAGISGSAVYMRFKKAGLPCRPSSESKRKSGLVSTADMYEIYVTDGKTLKEVATIVGISATSVRKRFIKGGLPCRSISELQRKPGLVTTVEMHSIYLKGKTLTEVAAIVGLHNSSVWKRFIKAGLSVRSISESHRKPGFQRKRHETFANNGNRSSGEWRLFSIFCSLGIPFIPEPQSCLKRKDGRRAFPDVHISDANLIIEYDGHYTHYTPEGKENDAERDDDLKKLHNIDTLRIGRAEIFTDNVLTRIGRALSKVA